MSVLTSIQLICNEVGVNEPTTVVPTTDPTVKKMIALMYRVGDQMRKMYQWSELNKQYDFALADAIDSYALPSDFDGFLYRTHWDVENRWELLGPLTPAEWQLQQTGIVPPGPRRMYRVKGYTGSEFSILPVPGVGDAGQVLRYEYQSKVWFLPPAWNTNTAYIEGQYVSYLGNVYLANTASQGENPSVFVSWTQILTPYTRFLTNEDEFILDEKAVESGAIAAWYRANGFAWEDRDILWRNDCKAAFIRKRGLRQLSLNNSIPFPYPNIPQTGVGQ